MYSLLTAVQRQVRHAFEKFEAAHEARTRGERELHAVERPNSPPSFSMRLDVNNILLYGAKIFYIYKESKRRRQSVCRFVKEIK